MPASIFLNACLWPPQPAPLRAEMSHPIRNDSGNVLFFILLAIVLIGAVTAAIQSGNTGQSASVEKESLSISLSSVKQYAGTLERGVRLIIDNGISESDLRFAHPDAPADYGDMTVNPTHQIFQQSGGAVDYQLPPSGINDGSPWEFYGTTALPQVGSDKADLVAVLPKVTEEFCRKVNAENGFNAATQPSDSGACLYGGSTGRFNNANQFDDSAPNTVTEASFSVKPSTEACVQCSSGEYHFYHVLMAR
jgi:hypothetical protein